MPHKLWILTSPRTGSSLLCNILNSGGLSPEIKEYFHPKSPHDKNILPPTNKMLSCYPIKNRLAMKNSKWIIDALKEKYNNMKFIILYRDITDQITSWHMAIHTHIWRLTKEINIKQNKQVPKVTQASVNFQLNRINEVSKCESYLKETNTNYLKLNYKDFCFLNEDNIAKIYNYANLKNNDITKVYKKTLIQRDVMPDFYKEVRKQVKNFLT